MSVSVDLDLNLVLGDSSNASSEVEYHDAVGYLIGNISRLFEIFLLVTNATGDHGRGIRTIMEMVALTRLDCATGSAGATI